MGADIKQRSDGHVEFKDERTGVRLGGPFRAMHFTITTAQILALDTVPITILAAPAAGTAYIIKNVYATKAAGTAYASVGAGDDINIRYTDGSGSIASTIETTGFLDSTAATLSYAPSLSCLPVDGAAIVASLGGNVTTGNSDVLLRIEYDIVNSPAF